MSACVETVFLLHYPMMALVLILFALLIGLLLLVFVLLGVFTRQPAPTASYERREYLLSAAETEFFHVLLQAIDQQQYVFAKVRISDLICIAGVTGESKAWWKHFAAIAQKHVDFVVATRHPVRPLVAVELDDSSHNTAKAKARDALVEGVLQAAGLPLLRVPYRASGYSVKDMRSHLDQVLAQRRSPDKKGHVARAQ